MDEIILSYSSRTIPDLLFIPECHFGSDVHYKEKHSEHNGFENKNISYHRIQFTFFDITILYLETRMTRLFPLTGRLL